MSFGLRRSNSATGQRVSDSQDEPAPGRNIPDQPSVLVCQFCQTTVYWSADEVLKTGKQSILPQRDTRLFIHAHGTLRGVIPLLTSMLPKGYLGYLILGDSEADVRDLRQAMIQQLGV